MWRQVMSKLLHLDKIFIFFGIICTNESLTIIHGMCIKLSVCFQVDSKPLLLATFLAYRKMYHLN